MSFWAVQHFILMPLVSAWQNFDLRVADRCHDRLIWSFSSNAVLHGEGPRGVVNSFCFSFVLFFPFFYERCNLRKKSVTVNSLFNITCMTATRGSCTKQEVGRENCCRPCLNVFSCRLSYSAGMYPCQSRFVFCFYFNEDTSHGIMHVHLEINPKCAFFDTVI